MIDNQRWAPYQPQSGKPGIKGAKTGLCLTAATSGGGATSTGAAFAVSKWKWPTIITGVPTNGEAEAAYYTASMPFGGRMVLPRATHSPRPPTASNGQSPLTARHRVSLRWWRSFLTAGSSGLYLFAYSVMYFFTQLEIVGFVPTLLYFTYMAIFATLFFLVTGTIGFYSCYWFVWIIYGAIKVD